MVSDLANNHLAVGPAELPAASHLLTQLRRGPAGLVYDELEKYGTDSRQELTEHQIRGALVTFHAVVRRVGINTFEDTATGSENAALRKLARSAIEFAHRVQHSPTSTRRDAGTALNIEKASFTALSRTG